jgi:lysophospholipase L1-like esterase
MAARPISARRAAAVAGLLLLVLTGCHDTSADGRPATAPDASAPAPGQPSSSAAAAPRFDRYVAIGDSYTAAPGVPGQQSEDGCLRSSADYPHLLAAALPVARLVDVSCSGADTGDVRTRQLRGVRPQLAAVTRDTDLVTIGLGGNDENLFITLVTGCLRQDPAATAGSPCTDALGPSVSPTLRRTQQSLERVVRDVHDRAPSARILLIGYPQIVASTGTCPDVPFAPADYRFVHEVNRQLTETVRRAAAATGVTYVDVWRASAGHDICSAEPWINGIDGPGAAPFHPFAAEQAAVARLVADAVG